MEEISKCFVCESEKFNNYLSCTDWFLSKEKFDLVECDNCGFIFTNPRPEENIIGKYYESEDYVSHTTEKKSVLNNIYEFVRKRKIKSKYKLISKEANGNKILDIGCATGELLNYFKQKNWDTYGIEPNEKARNFAIENYELNINGEEELKDFPDESFDVIMMWHVLEHVPLLNERIKELKRLLKPNGVIFIAIPNPDSWDAKHYKEYWAAYDVPRHLYHFTQKATKKLLERNNFRVSKIIPMKFDSFYICLLSEKYLSGSIKYLKAIKNGLKSNFYAKRNKNNYSSLIYMVKNQNI
ncbi:MAG: class I SAM-dependent methyltransferase [Saprospiraceae bacterium]|nr:class I SAM-dependent methyltransferase [Saprospiraceae bacterium]